MSSTNDDATRASLAAFEVERPRLVGALVRMVRDVALAEDLAQDVLVLALEEWPRGGIPTNPGAWLTVAAKNRAIDALRRRRMVDGKHAALAAEAEAVVHVRDDDIDEASLGDDLLRLVLVACHPVLSMEARAALTLRLLGGLTTEEIARAFLVPEPTIAQRIVRAKRTLSESRVPFDVPTGAELEARVPSVLEVVYLIFNEGYTATRGAEWMRVELCADALRLGRVLAGLLPAHAEVHGLVALMELHASRARARVGPRGEPVLLLDQDRARWDWLLVRRGLAALQRAESLARPLGPYALQAAIAACHARARTAAETDWPRIVALYDALVEITGSPVVELNRAVAVAMAYGPEAGIELVDDLADEPALRAYHLLPAVRGDLLEKLGRADEARRAFTAAAALTTNERERELLIARAGAAGRPRS
ncbi:MAG: sigma-70 family RNA polymerase sigma factor [Myxococcales bacterium]|nr:sigma-70 family RNA polymerase sigma factor [Myxococcales bacterium]